MNPAEPMNPNLGNPEAGRAEDLPDQIFDMHAAAMREMGEPRDGIRPTPVAYILACLFFAGWGGFYIASYGGDWTANGLAEKVSTVAAGPAAPQDPMVLGKEVFNACLQCHQSSGKGIAGSYPPLVASEYVLGDERRLAAILLHGIQGEFTVEGKKYNSEMPSWKQMGDEELAAVMTYIRNSWGNKAPGIKPDLVAAVRKETGTKSGHWDEASLKAFADTKPAAPAAAPAAEPAKK